MGSSGDMETPVLEGPFPAAHTSSFFKLLLMVKDVLEVLMNFSKVFPKTAGSAGTKYVM